MQGSGPGGDTRLQRDSVLTFDRLASKWTAELLNAHRSALTAKAYGYSLTYFSRWLTAVGVDFLSVTREDIQQWLAEEQLAGHQSITIRNRFGVVSSWYAWLTALDYIPKDPTLAILPIRVKMKLPDVMSVEEVDRMARACLTARELAIVETLYSTGARRAGLLGIRIQHLDFDGGHVKITGKGGKDILCYISPRAIRAIKKWLVEREAYPCLKRRPTDALFISRRGPLRCTQLGEIIEKIRERAKVLKRVTPHGFRHSHATHMKDRGVLLEDIQHDLGHANIQTTQIYTRTSPVKIRKAWRRLPRR